MALLDIFKKKPKKKAAKLIKKETKAAEEKPREEKKEVILASKKENKAEFREAFRVLRSPHVSEKASFLTRNNQYIFNVFPDVNKLEVKKAVESVYGVDTESVRIINVPRKQRRLGRTLGWRKGYKKAIVRIKEGQKIEIMPR